MDDLLTTRQLQELLQIDRTTPYCMRKDGRLAGVKVGNQWRFPRHEVEAMLSDSTESSHHLPASSTQILPFSCVQVIQDGQKDS